MDLNEFHAAGLLAQANEQFFWPLGLALTVDKDTETGETVELFVQRIDPYNVIVAGETYEERVDRAERVEAWLKERLGA